jgi:hypothetical protein
MGAVSKTPKLTTHELVAQALNRRSQRPGAIPLVDSLTIAREVMAQLDPDDYKAALEEVLPEFIRTTVVHRNRSLGAQRAGAGRRAARQQAEQESRKVMEAFKSDPAPANRAAIKTMLDAKKEERSVELIRRHSGEEAAERYKASRAAPEGDH